jgi:hypothetical protein
VPDGSDRPIARGRAVAGFGDDLEVGAGQPGPVTRRFFGSIGYGSDTGFRRGGTNDAYAGYGRHARDRDLWTALLRLMSRFVAI